MLKFIKIILALFKPAQKLSIPSIEKPVQPTNVYDIEILMLQQSLAALDIVTKELEIITNELASTIIFLKKVIVASNTNMLNQLAIEKRKTFKLIKTDDH